MYNSIIRPLYQKGKTATSFAREKRTGYQRTQLYLFRDTDANFGSFL